MCNKMIDLGSLAKSLRGGERPKHKSYVLTFFCRRSTMFKKKTCWLCLVMTGLFVGMAGAATLAPDGGSIVGNLSLWLRMPEVHYDPTTGVWEDLSGKGNDAVPVGEAAGRTYIAPTLSSGNNPIVLGSDFSTVKFAGGVDDLLRAGNLNSGAGLSELTIISVHKLTDLSGGQRPVGFGSWNDGSVANNFNLQVGDGSIRKDNGFVGAGNTAPQDLFFISVARMNPSSVDQWYNSNGALEHVQAVSGSSYTTSNDKFYLGDVRPSGGDTEIAEVLVYNTALSEAQIEGVSEWLQANVGIAVAKASNPSPADGAADVNRDTMLSWEQGLDGQTHNVYFGDTFEDVNSATSATDAGLTVTSFDPGRLEFGTTHFWRVDEVNGTPDKTVFKGDVWSFEVEPYSIQIPGSEITATASSASNEYSTPQKTLDGSGLGEDGTHAIQTETMWFTAMGDIDPWIQYEFDGVKKLDTMTVWNSNSSAEGFIGYGVQAVLIEYSLDGETWDLFEDVNEFSRASGLATYNQYDEIGLGGIAAKMVRLTIQSNFGGFMQAYSLSEVQFSMIPAAARTPEPASGSVDILPNAVVSWRAGREAAQTVVYLSTDPNAVADGIAASAISNTNSINLSAFDCELGQTYYWRADEVNETEATSVWAGPVWSFSTVATIVVEDFESYGNDSPDRPFQTWLDGIGYSADEFFPVEYNGNGTDAGIGHDIWDGGSAHYNGDIMEKANTMPGSGQSMPLYYGNTGGVASQTERSFSPAQDWTIGGAQTLSIAFSGQTGNTGTLYVKINNTKLTYPRAATNIAIGAWQAWNIDLSSMNVQAVTKLQIGVEGSGASGMILIDDIRLHAEAGEMITPADPGTNGLFAHYTFESNANDVSGEGHNGALLGNAAMTSDATRGQVLSLDGIDSCVDLGPANGFNFGGSFSVCAWINITDFTATWGHVIMGNRGEDNLGWQLRRHSSTSNLTFTVRGTEGADDPQGKVNVLAMAGEWTQVTAVYDMEAGLRSVYVNGMLDVQITDGGVCAASTHNVYIGARAVAADTGPEAFFYGMIDDVRVFNRALSDEEALSLAGITAPIDKPF